MAVKRLALCTALLILAACTPRPAITRIALLAPFEGRYREVGYNAYYAARLALDDPQIEFLPIDDGESLESAVQRAQAFAADPQVRAVLVLGYNATAPETLAAFGDLPVIVVGEWGALPEDGTFLLSARQVAELLTVPPRIEVAEAAALDAPLTGSVVFALAQFPALRADLTGITVLSSGSLPDADFVARYQSSGAFVPAPNLLATLVYDAARLVQASTAATRQQTRETLQTAVYNGITGTITFDDAGLWIDAPLRRYVYENGQLVAADQ